MYWLLFPNFTKTSMTQKITKQPTQKTEVHHLTCKERKGSRAESFYESQPGWSFWSRMLGGLSTQHNIRKRNSESCHSFKILPIWPAGVWELKCVSFLSNTKHSAAVCFCRFRSPTFLPQEQKNIKFGCNNSSYCLFLKEWFVWFQSSKGAH